MSHGLIAACSYGTSNNFPVVLRPSFFYIPSAAREPYTNEIANEVQVTFQLRKAF